MEALLVYKKSTYELYLDSPDKDTRRFILEESDSVEELKKSQGAQKQSLEKIVADLEAMGITYQLIYRADLKPVADTDVVISLGGDGTFLEVSHYINDIPIFGVNSDPKKSTGFYCCTNASGFREVFQRWVKKDYPTSKLHRLTLAVNSRELSEPVLNDILIAHSNPAATSVYELTADRMEVLDRKGRKLHRDSGLIIYTPSGSTAWAYEMGGPTISLTEEAFGYHCRDNRGSTFGLAYKRVDVHSLTRQGQIYVDGPHLKYPFSLGDKLRISLGKPLIVVGDLQQKNRGYPS